MINKAYGLLGLATRAGKIVFGTEACIKAINSKKVKLILIAADAAERTKLNFANECKKNNVPLIECFNIEDMSKAIGQSNKAVVGINDTNFSKEIMKIINGGEAIG